MVEDKYEKNAKRQGQHQERGVPATREDAIFNG